MDRKTSELGYEDFLNHEVEGIISENTRLLAALDDHKSTLILTSAPARDVVRELEIAFEEPGSGALPDTDLVLDKLHELWRGGQKVTVEDGPMKTTYWDVRMPHLKNPWTMIEERRLTARGDEAAHTLLHARVVGDVPKEVRDALNQQTEQSEESESTHPQSRWHRLGRRVLKAASQSGNARRHPMDWRRLQ